MFSVPEHNGDPPPNLVKLGCQGLSFLPQLIHLRPHVRSTLIHFPLEVADLLPESGNLVVVPAQLCHPLLVLGQQLPVCSPLVRGRVLVLANVVLQLAPQPIHCLLHSVLEGGELLQVPVPDLVLPALELGPQGTLYLAMILVKGNLDVIKVVLALFLLGCHVLLVPRAFSHKSLFLSDELVLMI